MCQIRLEPILPTEWELRYGGMVLYHWTIAWNSSRAVVYSRPGELFQGGFQASWKLSTCLMFSTIVEILHNVGIYDFPWFEKALRENGHGKKIDRYYKTQPCVNQ
jgi:hypothetical protein